MRWKTVQNMVDAIDTLGALSRLIQSLPNMVVLDHIQVKVEGALKSLSEVIKNVIDRHMKH